MLKRPCSVCGERKPGKLAALYAAWFLSDGSRTAWKQRLCVDCAFEELHPIFEHATDESSDLIMCPFDGTDSSADLDPIYLTFYPPKRDPRELELPTCGPCAAKFRALIQRGAERLPDRQNGSSGTSGTATDEWSRFDAA